MFEELGGRKYGAIYADPPWKFVTRSNKGKEKSPEKHYSCMSISDIMAMPVNDLAAEDCALFLWVTDPLLKEGIATLEAWGFTYKTVAFTWAKQSKTGAKWHMGCGYWTRANPEMCLLGIKGRPKRISCGVRQLVSDPVRQHSRKPDRIKGDIEQLVNGPYLELFSRKTTPGWDTWGNETGKFDD